MEKTVSLPPEHVNEEIEALNNKLYSLQLASLDENGEPCISYTPFLKLDGDYYIFISQLAKHTQNILRHPKVSALLIEDESNAKNMFARKRLNLKCNVLEIENSTEDWKQILDAFEAKQGNTVALLRTLSDFHLFKLAPESAIFVKGFGQAFELSGKSLSDIKHLKTQ